MFIYFILPRYYTWCGGGGSGSRGKQAHHNEKFCWKKSPQHNTKPSKVKWITRKKHRVQQNKSEPHLNCLQFMHEYGYVIWLCCYFFLLLLLLLLLLPHTSNHCWMNEQTNKRIALNVCVLFGWACVCVSVCVLFLFLLLLHHHRKLVFHKHILSFHQVHLVCLWRTAHAHTLTEAHRKHTKFVYLYVVWYTFKCLGNLMVEWQKWVQPVFLR